MDISDKFISARELIASAKGHLRELGEIVQGVVNKDCVTTIAEVDPDTLCTSYKLRAEIEVPPRASVRAFDVAVELRAALDHAVFAATVLHNPKLRDSKRTAFVIAKTKAHFRTSLANKKTAGDVPPHIAALMTRLQPYLRGRGWVLADLNEFRNIKDHRRFIGLSPSWVEAKSSLVTVPDEGSVFAKSLPPRSRLAHNEVELVPLLLPGFKLHPDKAYIQASVHVVLREPRRLRGQPVTHLLVAALEAVEHAVGEIEAETAKVLAARA